MNINDLIQVHRASVSDLLAKFKDREYFVDNSFQRRLVWTEKQKARLIETILMNYPVPEIYVWNQGADPATGKQKSSIVDGQQRITAVRQFVGNEWPLKASYLDEDNRTKEWANCSWINLDDKYKKQIWEYVFNVRSIPNTVSFEQITDLFRRLNETDKSLNPQELRNAEFHGEFIRASEELAKSEFWHDWKIFRENEVRRMGDIDFISSLLIFLRRGIVEGSTKVINEMYDAYNDVYTERETDVAQIQKFLSFTQKLFADNREIANFFYRPNDLYSLFCTIKIMEERGQSKFFTVDKLLEFIAAYEQEQDNPHVQLYKEGASSRTRSKSSREKRIFGLINYLTS